MHVHYMGAWCPWMSAKDFVSLGVTDGYEPPYGCWELNPGPLRSKK